MNATFKTLKKHAKTPTQLAVGKNKNEPIFYSHCAQFDEQWCDELSRSIRHTGWFTNEHGETFKDGSGKARGVVACFPARPGFPEGWFLAGYFWGDNGERVFYPEIFADPIEAALCADSHAEDFADSQREDDTKWNAARDIENKIEEKTTRLRECIALRHKKCMGYIRDEITAICASIREMSETLKTDYADYV